MQLLPGLVLFGRLGGVCCAGPVQIWLAAEVPLVNRGFAERNLGAAAACASAALAYGGEMRRKLDVLLPLLVGYVIDTAAVVVIAPIKTALGQTE